MVRVPPITVRVRDEQVAAGRRLLWRDRRGSLGSTTGDRQPVGVVSMTLTAVVMPVSPDPFNDAESTRPMEGVGRSVGPVSIMRQGA